MKRNTGGGSVSQRRTSKWDLESLQSLLGCATESLYELGSGHAFNVF